MGSVFRVLIFFFFPFLFSCSFYTPATVLPKTFEKRGDKSIAATVNFSSITLAAAYSPVDNLFIQAEGIITRQTYNYGGGLGGYFDLSEKVQLELSSVYGNGHYNWGDPQNGMSEPSTINIADGDLTHLDNLVSFNMDVGENTISIVGVNRLLTFNFDRTTYESLDNTTHNEIMLGGHIVGKYNMGKHANWIIDFGIETPMIGDPLLSFVPVIFRIGFEFH